MKRIVLFLCMFSAAGALKLLDPRLCAARKVRFLTHGSGYVEGIEFKNHM